MNEIPQHHTLLTSREVYQDLCYKIEKLVYMPGQGISENELSEKYGVSRHVIRDAFTRLKQRRLIEVYPQRGTYISLIDMHYIESILFLREAMEQEAIARIIEGGDAKALLEQLTAKNARQKKCWEENKDSDEYYRLDSEFHMCLLKAVGKEDAMSLVSDSFIHIRRWRNLEVRTEVRIQEILVEHDRIIEAIRRLDRDEAREAMHMHLDTVSRYGKYFKDVQRKYYFEM